MHVKQMDQHEGGALASREPAADGGQNQCAVAAVSDSEGVGACASEEHRPGDRREGFKMEGAVVVVEALVQPHLAFQKDATHECGCLVTVLAEHRSQGYGAARNTFGVFFDLILKRVGRGEQRSVGWQRERNLARDVGEKGALFREGI